MGKRLSATEKWDKAWYRKLPPKYKCFWEYLRDKCDLIGLWEIDYEAASFHIGEEITQTEMLKFFKDKISILDDKILILGFCHFQYGSVLNLKSPIHKKIYDLLVKHTLYDTLYNRVEVKEEEEVYNKEEVESKVIKAKFNFRKSLVEYGFKENLVDDWLKVRKTKKATNTETAFVGFINQVELYKYSIKGAYDINKILTECINRSWAGFKNEWLNDEKPTNVKPISLAQKMKNDYGIK